MARSLSLVLGTLALLTCSVQDPEGKRQSPWRVTGEVDLGDIPPLEDATLHVYLLDAQQDARARTIAHVAIYHYGTGRAAKRPKFLLEVGDLGPKGDYSIRVHIDLDRDDEISKGDFISTESYPVFQEGRSSKVLVKVTKV
jgi:hypothetical protein